MLGLTTSVLRMYDIGKHSGECSWLLETRCVYIYIYGRITKWWHVYTLRKQMLYESNATGAEFLEVQIPPGILMYD